MERKREQLQVKKERAILVGAIHRMRRGGGFKKHDNLVELTALVETAGAVVVDRFQQKIYRVNASTYIGKGKARMLCDRVERFDADVIIFDNDLSPGQIRDLEEIIQTKVIDRSELILDIFATRAQTRQARLQVELAQLEYTYPRLTSMWSHLDRLAGGAASGGVGTRGTGEKQLEIDKRLVNKRISELKRELEGIDKRKLREIDGRGEMFKVGIVGYTNAGKSTLMNALTDAGVFVEDRLFATLDTRTKKWELEGSSKVLLSDTVGFVSNLPHQLVASFKATLEEAVNADLLIHVVDVSTSEAFDQIKSVESVLKEIGCEKKDMLVVLNKADVLSESATLESLQTIYPEAICISAKTGMNLDKVAEAVLGKYHGSDVTVRVVADIGNGKLLSYLHANGRIISTEYTDDHVVMEVSMGKSNLHMIKRLKPVEIAILG
ncbi:MAG: GTPase HflX [Planctomycetes bacterium]|nr:GTPase HflX [Planctomycetota bacterium]